MTPPLPPFPRGSIHFMFYSRHRGPGLRAQLDVFLALGSRNPAPTKTKAPPRE